jgi:hypothetical protein
VAVLGPTGDSKSELDRRQALHPDLRSRLVAATGDNDPRDTTLPRANQVGAVLRENEILREKKSAE